MGLLFYCDSLSITLQHDTKVLIIMRHATIYAYYLHVASERHLLDSDKNG